MRTLSPMTLKDAYYTAIEAEIRRILDKIIYQPLVKAMNVPLMEIKAVENSGNALVDAIRNGKVWYAAGEFRGTFNAKVSLAIMRIGGKYDALRKVYKLPLIDLPTHISMAQSQANARYINMRDRMLTAIDGIDVQNVDLISKTQGEYEKSVAHMETDFQKATAKIAIEARMSPVQKDRIASEWSDNLELYIKGWAEENILKLRAQIQPQILAGGRAQGLVKMIQDNYGVATRKAKFLARQETALLMAKFQETRYADIGITKYRWSTAHDKRVRHDHHELNGKVYSFSNPPVTDKKTGARNNPGQDFNCRCVAIPLVD